MGSDQQHHDNNAIYIYTYTISSSTFGYLKVQIRFILSYHYCGLFLDWHNCKKSILRMKVKYYQETWMMVEFIMILMFFDALSHRYWY